MVRGRKKKPLTEGYSQELVNRIEECEIVINELDNSMVWKIVQKDLLQQKQMIDDNWQDLVDPDKLQKARELKFATMHVLSLKDKYSEEFKCKQKELQTYQNLETNIPKDYDLETRRE